MSRGQSRTGTRGSGSATEPMRRKKPVRRRRQRRTGVPWRRWIFLGMVLLLAATAWLVWPFWQLAGQFGSAPSMQPSRLYGRAQLLSVGQTLNLDRLASELEAMGYRALAADQGLTLGTFRRDGERLEVYRRPFPSPSGEMGQDRLQITVKGSKIARLRLLEEAAPDLSAASLDPPLIASYYGADLRERRPVSIDDLPEDLILSVLAAEDATFLSHKGISFTGILRAAWVNFRSNEVRQGGSTLTQQLVKNLYLTHERRLVRKIQEALLAVLIESRFDKRDILEAYLNEIYWGRSGSVHLMGVGAASWAYFGKHPAQLDLSECALLAGMIQSPASLSPQRHPEAAKARRDFVFGRLAQMRWVEAARLEAASRRPVETFQRARVVRQAPYFAAMVHDEARRRFGIETLEDAGYVLLSTLSLDDQKTAEAVMKEELKRLEGGWEKGRQGTTPLQGALISVDPRSGGILAYVGGRSFGESQFDRVSSARRQVGSAFKPIVYAAAFERGAATPSTFLEDAPYTVRLAGQTWQPQNSDGKYRGWVTARSALELSLNVPTARLAQRTGLENIVEMAHRLGVEQPLEPYPALALGAMEVTPREMATVYATFANNGRRPQLHGLTAIFDRNGAVVEGTPRRQPTQVLRGDIAFLVNSLLQGVLDRGTAKGARRQGISDAMAGKTGTTNSRRDSWFAGYSPDRATLVWVGYDDGSKTRLSGARAALPIWSRFSAAVRPAAGYASFATPEGIVVARIDPSTGGLATDRCPEVVAESFLSTSPPTELCPSHSGFRARPLDQPEGIEPEKKGHPFSRWLDMLRNKKKRRTF